MKQIDRDGRLKELRSCINNEERINDVLKVEAKLIKLSNHKLRSRAADMGDELAEAGANISKYLEDGDSVWAADGILLIIEYANVLKRELLRGGINVEDLL